MHQMIYSFVDELLQHLAAHPPVPSAFSVLLNYSHSSGLIPSCFVLTTSRLLKLYQSEEEREREREIATCLLRDFDETTVLSKLLRQQLY